MLFKVCRIRWLPAHLNWWITTTRVKIDESGSMGPHDLRTNDPSSPYIQAYLVPHSVEGNEVEEAVNMIIISWSSFGSWLQLQIDVTHPTYYQNQWIVWLS